MHTNDILVDNDAVLFSSRSHIAIKSKDLDDEDILITFCANGTYTSTGFHDNRNVDWRFEESKLQYRHEGMQWCNWGSFHEADSVPQLLSNWIIEYTILRSNHE